MSSLQKIVIVDDSGPIKKLGDRMLTAAGYEVCVADNGFDGLTVIMEEKPDLVLMDVEMPEMDGLTATAILKESEQCSKIPIVLLTSKDSPFDKARGEMVEAEGYLTKPFSKEGLIDAVKGYLESAS